MHHHVDVYRKITEKDMKENKNVTNDKIKIEKRLEKEGREERNEVEKHFLKVTFEHIKINPFSLFQITDISLCRIQ